MCCNNLLCASCARPVADGGCTACRAARAALHGQPMSVTAFAVTLLALLALAVALAARA